MIWNSSSRKLVREGLIIEGVLVFVIVEKFDGKMLNIFREVDLGERRYIFVIFILIEKGLFFC